VLITLAIIGVVAAITIPSIVANHQKRTLETQFAKAYRTIQQMVNLAVAEHGDFSTWDWKETYTSEERNAFVEKMFLPYLNVVKFCPSGENNICFADTMYKLLNGTNYLDINKQSKDPMAILADGSAIRFSLAANNSSNKRHSLSIMVDVNGAKKPNTMGLDLFNFAMYPLTGEFLPDGTNISTAYNEETNTYQKSTREQIEAGCNKNANGWYCPTKIIMDGFKMNY